jgi:hypothetical protein
MLHYTYIVSLVLNCFDSRSHGPKYVADITEAAEYSQPQYQRLLLICLVKNIHKCQPLCTVTSQRQDSSAHPHFHRNTQFNYRTTQHSAVTGQPNIVQLQDNSTLCSYRTNQHSALTGQPNTVHLQDNPTQCSYTTQHSALTGQPNTVQ